MIRALYDVCRRDAFAWNWMLRRDIERSVSEEALQQSVVYDLDAVVITSETNDNSTSSSTSSTSSSTLSQAPSTTSSTTSLKLASAFSSDAVYIPNYVCESMVLGSAWCSGVPKFLAALLGSRVAIKCVPKFSRFALVPGPKNTLRLVQIYWLSEDDQNRVVLVRNRFCAKGPLQTDVEVYASAVENQIPELCIAKESYIFNNCDFCSTNYSQSDLQSPSVTKLASMVCCCPESLRMRRTPEISGNSWQDFVAHTLRFGQALHVPVLLRKSDPTSTNEDQLLYEIPILMIMDITIGAKQEYRTKYLTNLGFDTSSPRLPLFWLKDLKDLMLDEYSQGNEDDDDGLNLLGGQVSHEHFSNPGSQHLLLLSNGENTTFQQQPQTRIEFEELLDTAVGGGAGELQGYREKNKSHSSSNEAKWKCKECDLKFTQSGHLKQHKLTVHDKYKPFVCNDCGMAFGARSNLTRHAKSVHEKIRSIGCAHCDKKFIQNSDLNQHMKRMHS